MGTNQEINQGMNEAPRNKPIKMVFKRNTKAKTKRASSTSEQSSDEIKKASEQTTHNKETDIPTPATKLPTIDDTKENDADSSNDSNEPRKNLSITLCKVSKSSDCYAVKSSTDSESDCSDKLHESGVNLLHNNLSQSRENTLQKHTHAQKTPKNKRKRKLDTKENANSTLSPSYNKERKKAKYDRKVEMGSPVDSSSDHQVVSAEDNKHLNNSHQDATNEQTNHLNSSMTSPYKFHKNMQYFGTGKLPCPDLGEEWYFEQIVRQQGKSAGNFDVYYFSPCKVRLRSKLKLQTFIADKMDLSNFDYNAGRFLQAGETITKKDALCSDKLQYYSDLKPEKVNKPKTPNKKRKTPKVKSTKKSTALVTKIINPKKKLLAFTSLQDSLEKSETPKNDIAENSTVCESGNLSVNSESSICSAENGEAFKNFNEEAIQMLSTFEGDFIVQDLIELAWKCLGATKKRTFISFKPNANNFTSNSMISRFLTEHRKNLARRSGLGTTGRAVRCRDCPACLAPNCGSCGNCKDMKIFGGSGTKKQGCMLRKCKTKVKSNLLKSLTGRRRKGKSLNNLSLKYFSPVKNFPSKNQLPSLVVSERYRPVLSSTPFYQRSPRLNTSISPQLAVSCSPDFYPINDNEKDPLSNEQNLSFRCPNLQNVESTGSNELEDGIGTDLNNSTTTYIGSSNNNKMNHENNLIKEFDLKTKENSVNKSIDMDVLDSTASNTHPLNKPTVQPFLNLDVLKKKNAAKNLFNNVAMESISLTQDEDSNSHHEMTDYQPLEDELPSLKYRKHRKRNFSRPNHVTMPQEIKLISEDTKPQEHSSLLKTKIEQLDDVTPPNLAASFVSDESNSSTSSHCFSLKNDKCTMNNDSLKQCTVDT